MSGRPEPPPSPAPNSLSNAGGRKDVQAVLKLLVRQWSTIGSVALIAFGVWLAYYTISNSENQPLNQREQTLFQVVIIGLTFTGTFVVGRNSREWGTEPPCSCTHKGRVPDSFLALGTPECQSGRNGEAPVRGPTERPRVSGVVRRGRRTRPCSDQCMEDITTWPR